MYAVIGASGNTGSVVAQTLLDLGKQVRVVVRRAQAGAAFVRQGAEVAVADLADDAALASALTGVDGAYVMTPPLLEAEDPDAIKRAFIHAIRTGAERAGAPPLVVLSSMGAHLPSGTGPVRSLHALERALHDYPGSLSLLRPPYFLDNWAEVMVPATGSGIVPSLIGRGVEIDMASTVDIGRTAAGLLLEAHAGHRVVELRGALRYTAHDVASGLGRLLGKPLEVLYPPRAEWDAILMDAGLSAAGALQMAELLDGINAGRIDLSFEGECRTVHEGPDAVFRRLLAGLPLPGANFTR